MSEGNHIGDDVQFWTLCTGITNRVTARFNAVQKSGEVLRAGMLLYGRVAESCNSLQVLLTYAPHNITFDGATVLRGMHDAMLQGLYILTHPSKREERARLFLEYVAIERYRLVRLVDGNQSSVAKWVSTSPHRPSAEPALKAEVARIRANYLDAKGKLRGQWYPGSLRELARDIGLEAEYELLQRQLSGAVHSSPLTLTTPNCSVTRSHMVTYAWFFSLRLLRLLAEVAGIPLKADEQELLEVVKQGLFDGPMKR